MEVGGHRTQSISTGRDDLMLILFLFCATLPRVRMALWNSELISFAIISCLILSLWLMSVKYFSKRNFTLYVVMNEIRQSPDINEHRDHGVEWIQNSEWLNTVCPWSVTDTVPNILFSFNYKMNIYSQLCEQIKMDSFRFVRWREAGILICMLIFG